MERNYPSIRGSAIVIIRRLGLTPDDDLISELVLECLKNAHKCRADSDAGLRAYCYGVSRFKLLGIVRNHAKRRSIIAVTLPAEYDLRGQFDDVPEFVFRDALESIHEPYRELLKLAHGIDCEQMKYQAIAKRIGKPLTTTYRYHCKALDMLTRLLLSDA
jgi:RNA polymerase sigma factor (sigma-70 family)